MTPERIKELREVDDCCDDDTLACLNECLDEIERLRVALMQIKERRGHDSTETTDIAVAALEVK